MSEELCIQKALQIRYSLPRLHWLIGIMSLVSLLYLSSEELWNILDSEKLPNVSVTGFMFYLTFFVSILMLVNYVDIKRFVTKKRIAVCASLASIGIDLFLICLVEFLVLYSIQVIPQDISKGIMLLLIGALPSSLGAIVLTSLTAESLKKQAKKLFKEVQILHKEVEELEEQRRVAREKSKAFDKKKKEFEDYFKENGKKK